MSYRGATIRAYKLGRSWGVVWRLGNTTSQTYPVFPLRRLAVQAAFDSIDCWIATMSPTEPPDS